VTIVVIICLGIMNTAIASACARLAGQDQVGGLYGVMEFMENLAGLVGPALGGRFFKLHPLLPISSVVFIYFLVFLAVCFFYRSTIVLYERPPSPTATTLSDPASSSELMEKEGDKEEVDSVRSGPTTTSSSVSLVSSLEDEEDDFQRGGEKMHGLELSKSPVSVLAVDDESLPRSGNESLLNGIKGNEINSPPRLLKEKKEL
jgi:hypothetical protein